MSEKIKGIYGSESRADEVLAWLKNQGAGEHAFNGTVEDCIYFVYQGHVRTASKEHSILFDIVDLPRWRAEKGGEYYYASDFGHVFSTRDIFGDIDDGRYKVGNYFKTKKEAEPYAEKIREIFKRKETE